MSKLSFKLRAIIYFAIAAVIPFLISWYLIYQIVDNKLYDDLKHLYKVYVQNQVNKIEQMFIKQEDIIKSMANSFYYISSDETHIKSFLIQQIKINRHFKNMYVIMSDGQVIVGDKHTYSIEQDLTLSSVYLNTIKSNKIVWLESYKDVISGEKCVGIAMPIKYKNGAKSGVLVGNISEQYFRYMLSKSNYLSDVNVLLIDSSGYIKFDSFGKYGYLSNIEDEGFILNDVSNDIINLTNGSHEITHDGKQWICEFSSISFNEWKVISIIDTKNINSLVNNNDMNIFNYIILIGFIAVTLVIVLALILSNSITKPLLKLRDGARALAVGELDYKIEINSKDEIKELADSFNYMSTNLKNTYQQLFTRTEELFDNNQYLQEINTELEASYQQLGATMSQLNQSEEKFRKLMKNISDMVFVIGTDCKISYVNQVMINVLGYKESDLIGNSVSIILKEVREDCPLKEAFSNEYIQYQLDMVKKDGTKIIVEGSAQKVVEEGNVVGVQTIARDITHRKHMEKQLDKRYNELQVLNKVSNAITNTLNLDNLLQTIVKQVIDVSEALVCSIRLFDDAKDNNLQLVAIEGVIISNISIEDVVISKHNIESFIAKKRSVVIELKEDQLINEYLIKLFDEEHARYIIFNPLVVQGIAIGVMSTTLRKKPEEDQVELLTSLANSIAIAIDNAQAYEKMKQSYIKTVESLVSAIEAKDVYTESHSVRVANYACFIAMEMGYSKEIMEDIWVAGMLHDIGKIGITDSIINKKERLTAEEYEIVKQHPSISFKILSKIGLKEEIIGAVKHHHERYDGKGYPDGLRDNQISTMSAIISIADAFDAITSERSYKKSKTIEQGIAEIVVNSGKQFDPKVVDIFERAFLMKPKQIERIYNNENIDLL